jgi:hypothetical protein
VLSPLLANLFSISSNAVKDVAIDAGLLDGNHLILMCTVSVMAWSELFWLSYLPQAKGPSSIAMAMGISIVIMVALATSLSTSSNYCLA